GEAVAGSGCSSAGNTSSSYGIYLGYTDFGIKSSRGGDCGSSGPGPTTPGDPMSDKPSNGLDISVCVTPDSSESNMTVSKNPK
ncbi:hypothetical protein Tco_0427197, partial [Tanacetum coccineum]